METIDKKRVQNLDIARTFAIICVVLCHSIECAYSNIGYDKLSNASQIFRIVFFTIGRLGVPIFLFLTGVLTLRKQINNDDDVKKFYKKNLLPLFITTQIWNVLYNIFLAIMQRQFDIKILIENMLFFKKVNLPNMWYIPMILGMYLAIPFIAKIVKTFTLNMIKIPMIIVMITSIVIPSLNIMLKAWGLQQYQIILDLSFFGGIYGIYILLGYYISNGLLKKYSNIFLIVIGIISFAITCIIQYFTYKVGKGCNVWYNFVTLFICAICIFELFTRIKNKDSKNCIIKVTEYISKISFGIFFVHEIFLKVFVKYTVKMNLNNPLESIILFIVATICSIIFIYFTSKIKFVKEKIFLIKN